MEPGQRWYQVTTRQYQAAGGEGAQCGQVGLLLLLLLLLLLFYYLYYSYDKLSYYNLRMNCSYSCRVLDDRSVLFKYMNPNLGLVMGEGVDTSAKAFITGEIGE